MKVLIVHGSIVQHDAIGNDIYWMSKVLSEAKNVFCYADHHYIEGLSFIPIEEVFELIKHPENVLIYHHSIFWELGEEILRRACCKIIFKYHNITPGHFFSDFSKISVENCKRGREQTERLCKLFRDSLWLCDSDYNALDLFDFNRKKIVPPFHMIESWYNEISDNKKSQELSHLKKLKLLFVGRIAPNKGYFHIFKSIKEYINLYDDKIIIYLVGKSYDLNYYFELVSEILKLGIQEQVRFVGEASKSEIKAYYSNSDLFLCMSEHEGFCVPIVEAQYFNLPIIGYKQEAVMETMGSNQIALEMNYQLFAKAIWQVKNDIKLKKDLKTYGRRNYESRFRFEKIKFDFLDSLKFEGVL